MVADRATLVGAERGGVIAQRIAAAVRLAAGLRVGPGLRAARTAPSAGAVSPACSPPNCCSAPGSSSRSAVTSCWAAPAAAATAAVATAAAAPASAASGSAGSAGRGGGGTTSGAGVGSGGGVWRRRCRRRRCRLDMGLRRWRRWGRRGGGGASIGCGFGGVVTGGAGGAASFAGAGTWAWRGACIDAWAVPWNTIATVVSGGSSSLGVKAGRPISRNSNTARCSSAETISPMRRPRGHAQDACDRMRVTGPEQLLQHAVPVTCHSGGCSPGHGSELHEPRSDLRGPTAGLPGSRRRRGLFGQQRDLGEAALGDRAHHLHDPAVGEILVAAHEDAPLRVVLGDRLQLVDEIGDIDRLVLQEDRAVGLDRDGQRLAVAVQRLGVGLRQIDRHAGGHQRRGDHEDDQQHQHHVDQRRDVDLRQRPVAAPAPAAAARSWDIAMAYSSALRFGGTGWR